MFRNLIKYKIVYFLTIGITALYSCDKQEESRQLSSFVISESIHLEDKIDSIYPASIEGGKDTLYIHTTKDFKVSSETNSLEKWVTIDKVEKLDNNISQVIIDIKPLLETFEKRSNVLSFITEDLDGGFVSMSQGYIRRFNDNFNWLRYGVLNPLDEGREVLLENWTSTQKSNGWTSTIGEKESSAHVYGRFEYVKMGSVSYGADLISRNIGGIERDSILVLTFNALAYSPLFADRDGNKLTLELQNGCTFLDNSTIKTIELNYFDSQSALIEKNLWNNSFHSFYLKKPDNNTVISTIKIKFLTGSDISTASNRVILDNFNIYSVLEYKP
ncbi:hypothetical protein [Sphingobacterium bovisgrunnientis]|uniref:hypothetical protein n=1 Tax=Sphingobacterium bovisgrunnientis TaxID=1874697 RepID=UPI0013596A4F|nr:hypothetical protein [Sphingobacterium bovisgrunnientis]